MLFEVLRQGKPLMCTNSVSCIYPYDTLKTMMEAGLTFTLNGQPWRPTRKSRAALEGQYGT